MSVSIKHQKVLDGTLSTDQALYYDIGSWDQISFHVVHPGVGSVSFDVSNDTSFTSNQDNPTLMAQKNWVQAYVYNFATQAWVSSVTLSGTEDMIALSKEILIARYLRFNLTSPVGAYQVYLNVKGD